MPNNPDKKATTKPVKKQYQGIVKVVLEVATSSAKALAKIMGKDNKKENSTASFLSTFSSFKVDIVVQLLESPGKVAMPWTAPQTTTTQVGFAHKGLLFDVGKRLVSHSKIVVSAKPIVNK